MSNLFLLQQQPEGLWRCTYLWFPLPSWRHTSHSNCFPVSETILSQFCCTISAASTIQLSARACSYDPTIRYPMPSDKCLAIPRIRSSDIWGSLVTGFVLEIWVKKAIINHIIIKRTVQKAAPAILFHDLDTFIKHLVKDATDCNVGHMPATVRLTRWGTALIASAKDPNDYQKAWWM